MVMAQYDLCHYVHLEIRMLLKTGKYQWAFFLSKRAKSPMIITKPSPSLPLTLPSFSPSLPFPHSAHSDPSFHNHGNNLRLRRRSDQTRWTNRSRRLRPKLRPGLRQVLRNTLVQAHKRKKRVRYLRDVRNLFPNTFRPFLQRQPLAFSRRGR